VRHGSRWLVDGGLVNPVPVSVCRALGADLVIAVNLNGDLVSRHNGIGQPTAGEKLAEELTEEQSWWERVTSAVNVPFLRKSEEPPTPGFLDVMASSVSIMQDRITRSRLAGDPPDAVLHPRLGHLQLLDFDHAEEAIAEGHACVQRALPLLRHVLGMPPVATMPTMA
jgi:NTE family protein